MGGDTKLTQVRTSTNNGRRVLILKDSFGNAIPGYLFFSFEEVHVVDFRYFTKNMMAYVEENHITDILFANNIFNAYSSHTYRNYARFLAQKAGTYSPEKIEDSIKRDGDSTMSTRQGAEQSVEQPTTKQTTDAEQTEKPSESQTDNTGQSQTDDAGQTPATGDSID